MPERREVLWFSVAIMLMMLFVHDRTAAQANTIPVAVPLAASQHMCGVYRGLVLNSVDPDNKRRVQVRIPEANVSSLWALPGASAGQLPSVGSAVWIMFEAGNAMRPVWFGSPP